MITNGEPEGVYLIGAAPKIYKCEIKENFTGLRILNSSPIINNSKILNNSPGGGVKFPFPPSNNIGH